MTDEDDGEEEIALQDRNGASQKIGPNILNNQVKIVSFLIGLFYRLIVVCNYCSKLFLY